jgi:anthranilate synthase component 2
MILMIDNYDSFTWNLVQYLGELGAEVRVVRNDEASVDTLRAMRPDRVIVSPGPGNPDAAGVTLEAIRRFGADTPVLGVCLGHQAIGQAYGGHVRHAQVVMHGKVSPVHHDGAGVFRGLPTPFAATRYHSLAVDRPTLPGCLQVTAWTLDGEIMGLRHRMLPVEGVQFHPESILTEHGHTLLRNFLTP